MIIIDIVLSIVSYLIAVLTLGLAIGFSPLIYGAFGASFAQKPPLRRRLQLGLIGGVLAATLVLLAFGAALGMLYDHATTSGLYRWLIGIAGGVLVVGALSYWFVKPAAQTPAKPAKRFMRPSTLALLGFTKTIFSAMSLAAALIASTIFATIGNQPVIALLVVVAICLGAIMPFAVVMLSKRASRQATKWISKTQAYFASLHASHHQTVAVALACCGLALIAYALSH